MAGGNLVVFGSAGLLQPLLQASSPGGGLRKAPSLRSAGMRLGCESSRNLKRKREQASSRALMVTRTSHTSSAWVFKNDPIDLGEELVVVVVVVIKLASLEKDFILLRDFILCTVARNDCLLSLETFFEA